MKQRTTKLKLSLGLKLKDALIVFSESNIYYLSKFNGHAATIVLTQQNNYLITDYRYYDQAKQQANNIIVICRDRVKQSLGDLINLLLIENSINKVLFESDHISVSQWEIIYSALECNEFEATNRSIEDMRFYKDKKEIDQIQQAAKIADQALEKILDCIRKGVSERDLSIELEYQMRKLGSEKMSFPTIIGFAERSALPHCSPSNKKLNKGDLILIDFGAVINGYHSDMTRTYVYGKATPQQKEIYDTVYRAQRSAIDALAEGVTGEYLFNQSEKILKKSQYAKFRGEGLGHGVGLELYENPFLGKNCQMKIAKGCVITIEPGIYIPGWGGIRIEDDVVLTDNGVHVLTKSPKQPFEL